MIKRGWGGVCFWGGFFGLVCLVLGGVWGGWWWFLGFFTLPTLAGTQIAVSVEAGLWRRKRMDAPIS